MRKELKNLTILHKYFKKLIYVNNKKRCKDIFKTFYSKYG